ncbi:MAG: BlaI/MecI/CopY family transcriptional regulator [Planctomycetes bacterium]|nr:BlaI/MecI/CopY family transcriptional regulator [Planctomycetota bacterium]
MTATHLRTPGRLELALLDVLWRDAPATSHAARERLPREKRPTNNTALAVLRRMEARGWLARERVSRSYAYRDVVDPAATRRRTLQDLLARLFEDSPEGRASIRRGLPALHTPAQAHVPGRPASRGGRRGRSPVRYT